MGMHEIEGLVEATVRRLDTGAPDQMLDLRTLFWNLYDYHNSYDTGNTLFRVVTILVRHRYLYHFPVEMHPDFERYPEYFESLKDKGFEDIHIDPPKPWKHDTNKTAGFYCDPVREWGSSFCMRNGWGDLAKPQLYCEAGSPLWESWVAAGRLTGADAVRPTKLDRSELFQILMKEIVRQKDFDLAAEWYQMGIVYEFGNPHGEQLKTLQKNSSLSAIRKFAAEHKLHTIPIRRGFMDIGEEKTDTFLAWWQNPDEEKKEPTKTWTLDPAKERAITEAIAKRVKGEEVEPIWYASGLWFDGEAVHGYVGELAGADPFTIRPINSSVTADKTHVWHSNYLVSNVDPETFEVLGGVDGIYAKDANHVYISERLDYRPIAGADSKTFKLLDFAFASDAKNVYYRDQILEGIGEKFTIDEVGFLKGEQAVYHYGFRLPVDALSFQVVNLEEKLKETNSFMGEFILSDRDGTYRFNSAVSPPQFGRTVVEHFSHPHFDIDLVPADENAGSADLCKVSFRVENRRWSESDVLRLLDILLPPEVRGASTSPYTFENGPSWNGRLRRAEDLDSYSRIEIIGKGVQKTWKPAECIRQACAQWRT
jgi:hypothetical protein